MSASFPSRPEGISEERHREAVERTQRLRELLGSPEYLEAVAVSRATARRPSTYTYFIWLELPPPQIGPIKIGCAGDPYARLDQLQTSSPYELTLIGYVPGGERLERELHKKYAHLHLRGEWFQPNWEMEQYIFNLIWDTPGGVAVMEGLRDD